MNKAEEKPEKIVLSKYEWIDLWLKGQKEWNDWVEKHPVSDVDFSGVDFGVLQKKHQLIDIVFAGFVFPKGKVDFSRAKFEGDAVSIDFTKAKFGKGAVDFRHAGFDIGAWKFTDVDFGEGPVDFSFAKFGKGLVGFRGTKFGKGDVNFMGAKFGAGGAEFTHAKFGEGDVIFSSAKFGGNVSFSFAQFGEGNISFGNAEFESGKIELRSIQKAKGLFLFRPKPLRQCTQLDFSSSTFEGALSLAGLETPTVVNLCHSSLSHPLDLHDAHIEFRDERYLKIFKRAINKNDAASFRRLKKLAKDADDHQRTLDFFAKEMKSNYWHNTNNLELFYFYLYDWISDYGRSLMRPFICLLACLASFAALYSNIATQTTHSAIDAISFSFGNSFPLYIGAREGAASAKDILFCVPPPDYLFLVTGAQNILSSVFLFLIVLALRNRFRS